MSATKLGLYNEALEIVGERELASLTEAREPRRLLDNAWARGFIDEVLEQGHWNFATRSAQVEFSPDTTPSFGYRRAFDKPADWIRTSAISSDEYFVTPLVEYVDEADFWYASIDTIYVRYVSSDTTYGGDLSRWPASFRRYAAFTLAMHIAPKLTALSDEKIKLLHSQHKKALADARSKDAMNQPPGFPPQGSFVSARHGRSGGQRSRGSRSALIG